MDVLRQIWTRYPQHVPTLELIREVCEKTSDEAALPEVLGALGRACEQAGDLEKAEGVYEQLVIRAPNNDEYQSLLKSIRQRLGKEVEPPSGVPLTEFDLASIPEAEAVPAEPAVDSEQENMVKEALENSDLFSRYGLTDKAVVELEKVLDAYPNQVEIHQRIFEVCHRTHPARASQAAEALARILRKEGDLEGAKKYQDLLSQVSQAAPAARAEVAPPSAPPAPVEVDLSDVFSATGTQEVPTEEPRELPLDLAAPLGAEAPAPVEEMDLSTSFSAVTETPSATFNYNEARQEIEFYLGQSFLDEARSSVQTLEEKFPGNAQVAALRQMVEGQTAPSAARVEEPAPPPPVAPAAEKPLTPVAAPPIEMISPPPARPAEVRRVPSKPTPPPAPPEPAEVATGPVAPPEAPGAGSDMLGSLVGDLEAGLEGFGEATPPPPPAKSQPGATANRPGGTADGASQLSGLLDELDEAGGAGAAEDDPDKHYNLGTAFREMGLLDEAIGEFQKVVKGAQKDHYPPNFLQACSLLAVCFTDKGMPAIAVKWYLRALESPDLDEEGLLALQYDLGVAYEQAGDTRAALEKFSEVYSQNIDYRDVAEKIRTLQQKAR